MRARAYRHAAQAADFDATRPGLVRRRRADRHPFIAREGLAPGAVLDGPLVVTQFDATTLVPPGSRLAVEPSGGLLIEVEP